MNERIRVNLPKLKGLEIIREEGLKEPSNPFYFILCFYPFCQMILNPSFNPPNKQSIKPNYNYKSLQKKKNRVYSIIFIFVVAIN
jgi:hypothetical protein